MSSVAHLGGLVLGPIVPLIIYSFTKDSFVAENARISINWQSSILLYIFTMSLIFSTAASYAVPYAVVSMFTLNIIITIDAANSSTNGKIVRYPASIPVIKKHEDDIEDIDSTDNIDVVKRMYMNGLISEEKFEEKVEQIIRNKNESVGYKDESDKSKLKNKV